MARVKSYPVRSCGKTHPYCKECRPDLVEARKKTRSTPKEHVRPCRNCGRCDACLGLTTADGTKKCRTCEQVLPLYLFQQRTDTGGYRNQCRACRNKLVPYARCSRCNVYTHAYGKETVCSACRKEDDRTFECAQCGTSFIRSVKLRKYCSTECAEAGKLEYRRQEHRKVREEILRAYGGEHPSCACCGEDIHHFLAIDHIDGGGHKQYKELGGGGFTNWIRKNNYPPVLRILCHNCNHGRHLNGGTCPHEDQ